MKIVYDDIIYSLQKAGGVSVVFTELFKRIKENVFHYLYASATNNFFYEESFFPNKKLWNGKFLSLKRYLNPHIKEKESFIFHSTYYRICKNKNAINITTVHDFTYEYFRNDLKSNLHKIQKRNAVMHSDGVICISENTKADLLKFYPHYKGLIKVINNGYSAGNYFYEPDIPKTKKVLFVGARTAYKRFDVCVDLVKELKDCCLYIVGGGRLSRDERALLEANLPGRYRETGHLSDSDLRHLYNEAFFLCYPSEYEGFGIPIVEAQACGCPVVCQKKSSVPEVAADAAVYIDSDDFAASLEAVTRLYDSELYDSIQKKGFENVKRFSWDKCAAEVKAFYQEVCDYAMNKA